MALSDLFANRMHYFLELPFEQALALYEASDTKYQSPDVTVIDQEIYGRHGAIPIRIYKPASASTPLPVIIWMHGGGFARGTYLMNEGDVISRELSYLGDFVLVNVEYRLVNEKVKFPAPQDDCMDVLDWVQANISIFHGRTDAIFVGGVSAGACLAATMAVIDRNRGTRYIAGQLLNCPLVHRVLPDLTPELVSKTGELVRHLVFSNEFVAEINANTISSGDLRDAQAEWWAGEVRNLNDLPPAQIINCEYDSLRASGEKYALQLEAAGVEVEVISQPGVTHAHLNRLPEDCPEVVTTLNDMIRFVTRIISSIGEK